MRIDLTPIFQAVIALLSAVITVKLIPYIKSKSTQQQYTNLTAVAKIVVYAAEQIFGTEESTEKLNYAVRQLSQAGFDLDLETLRAAVEQAVYDMNAEKQIRESIKVEPAITIFEGEET